MNKRACYNCDSHIPPGTEHFILSDEIYCAECVEVHEYRAYSFYVDGEYMGSSEDGEGSKRVEDYEDDCYEEEEAE